MFVDDGEEDKNLTNLTTKMLSPGDKTSKISKRTLYHTSKEAKLSLKTAINKNLVVSI